MSSYADCRVLGIHEKFIIFPSKIWGKDEKRMSSCADCRGLGIQEKFIIFPIKIWGKDEKIKTSEILFAMV